MNKEAEWRCSQRLLRVGRMNSERPPSLNRHALDALYARYNRREMIQSDPVQFVYWYEDRRDREIAGLVASSLALGNIRQILASVRFVLQRMKPSPLRYLDPLSREELQRTFAGFRHRFITGDELASMLFGAKCMIERCGSLHACFSANLRASDDTILPALSAFVKALGSASNGQRNRLLPPPEKGSACKRLHLFLRWMVRRDSVDPGGWEDVPAAQLIVPLDTHIHRICHVLGLTKRRQANMHTALEVTSAFREIIPEDPVRYDFALAHLGIDGGKNLDLFLKRCGVAQTR